MGRWVEQLFTDATAGATSNVVRNRNGIGTTFQARIAGSAGAQQANITLYGNHSNDATYGVAIATIILGDGTVTTDNQMASIPADYPYYYATLNSISGTGAKVNMFLGV